MDMPVALGDVLLGKYRIERVLGKGGMGIVLAGRHIELGQLVAIKLLLPEALTDEEIVERFSREARAASQLQSEHIVRVHDFGRMADGAPYMVMEHLDGCDLKELLAKEGPLPVSLAITYLAQVCDAMAEAHSAGVVHRDLKPANLFLVRRRNGSACIKVLDFGISKHLGMRGVDLTKSTAMLGSPLYMSPEQILTSKSVDPRADIWALGVILYELLTGISPFKCGSVYNAFANILQDEPKPIREFLPNVPAHIEAVITRCLRKSPDDRFQCAEDLQVALEGGNPATQQPLLPMTTAKIVMAVAGRTPPVDPGAITAVQEATGERTPMAFREPDTARIQRQPSSLVLASIAALCVVLIGGTLFAVRGVLKPKNEPTPSVAPAMPDSVDTSFVAAPPVVPPITLPEDAGLSDAETSNADAATALSSAEIPTPPPSSSQAPTAKKKGIVIENSQSGTAKRKADLYGTR